MRARVRKQSAFPPWPAVVAAALPHGPVGSPFGEPDWRASLAKAKREGATIVLDAPHGVSAEELGRLYDPAAKMLLGHEDSAEARAVFSRLGLRMFKAIGAPDRLFASNFEPEPAAEPALTRVAAEPAKFSSLPAEIKVLKAVDESVDEDERIVYGIVLEPDGVDAQNDTVSAEEIRQAAHRFMQEFANVGLQHQAFINGKARILESFVAPADFELDGQTIRKGTWLMAMRILDDEIWTAVKSGKITGFSIGGSAVRRPVT